MLNFKDNFTEVLLISEHPVIFYLDEPYLLDLTDITMKLPTMKDVLNNPYLQQALAVFSMTANELEKAWKIQIGSKWNLIKLCQKELSKSIGRKIVYLFAHLFGE